MTVDNGHVHLHNSRLGQGGRDPPPFLRHLSGAELGNIEQRPGTAEREVRAGTEASVTVVMNVMASSQPRGNTSASFPYSPLRCSDVSEGRSDEVRLTDEMGWKRGQVQL